MSESVNGQGGNQQARQTALEKLSGYRLEPTGLVQYRSRGSVLVIGDMQALEYAPRLDGVLTPQVLLTEGAEEPGVPVVHQAGRPLSISGHLGHFRILLGEQGSSNAELLQADLILDLSPEPLLTQAMPPPGYLHSAASEEALTRAVDTLSGLVGEFEKPTYFSYDAERCAHGRSGHIACNRCIDACPAQAITGLLESVEVNSNLCQGGGICSTVCPSGAIRYAYPGPKDTLQQLRIVLAGYREAGGTEPVIGLFAAEDGELPSFEQDNLLPLQVEELASVGIEMWLSALALGARQVVLVDRGAMPDAVALALESQLQTAREILQAMGYSPDAIRLIRPDQPLGLLDALMPQIRPAAFGALQDKRQGLYMAIDHLYAQAERARPMVQLSVGAPLGTAQVDGNSCTLCMACVSACPGKALQHGQGIPQLGFIESNCLQCGICTRTCPEDAIWITPRLLFDREARNARTVLAEDTPFHCTGCGKAFATRSVISRMLTKLQGHSMFQGERALSRLKMCEDCRVVDAMDDPESMLSGMEGQIRQ